MGNPTFRWEGSHNDAMPEIKDARLDKLLLWSLQTIFGIGLLVASWFLGGLYERLDKVDARVGENNTQTRINEERISNVTDVNQVQWKKLNDLENRINRLENRNQ